MGHANSASARTKIDRLKQRRLIGSPVDRVRSDTKLMRNAWMSYQTLNSHLAWSRINAPARGRCAGCQAKRVFSASNNVTCSAISTRLVSRRTKTLNIASPPPLKNCTEQDRRPWKSRSTR